jgi:CYTH domain-containing protein/thymidylate kinase
MAGASRKQTITRIVITGGPCAGKTTAMSWIQNAFTEKGYLVLFVDETATQLSRGGAPWKLTRDNQEYQYCVTRLMLAKEEAFTDIAKTFEADKVLVVCDRGALDNRAYMSEGEFRYVLDKLRTTEVELRDHYDAVFHLVTAAKGAEEFYTNANNAARYETVQEAVESDDRLIAAWTGHPHLRIIDNRYSFDEKMLALIREISSFLGEPRPMETKRKYLIARPDPAVLGCRPNCRHVEITQAYLRSDIPGETIRIRQRGCEGSYVYFKTRKRTVDGRRIEMEERLTRREFRDLLLQADPEYRTLRKDRWCLSENGLYYNIDIFPEWDDRALLEVELYGADDRVVFPEGIEVIREVTGEKEFTNPEIARIRKDRQGL